MKKMTIPVFKRSEFIEYVERHLKGRKEMRNITKMDDEINFMMGACAAVTFLTVMPDKKTGRREKISDVIPPYWFFAPMGGYSVLDPAGKHDPYGED